MQLHYTPILRTAALISEYGWTPALIEKHLHSLSTTGAGIFDERDVIRVMHSQEFSDDLITEVTQDKRKTQDSVRLDLHRHRCRAKTHQHDLWVEALGYF